MSILLYCAAERDKGSHGALAGVKGLPVLCTEHSGIEVFYSQHVHDENWTTPSLEQTAKQFHAVLRQLFQNRAVIPFRFPTVLKDQESLREHLAGAAGEYAAQIRKFADDVQMEAMFSETAHAAIVGETSGTEYLRQKQKRDAAYGSAIAALQGFAGTLVGDWKQKQTPSGIRLFALVKRTAVSGFLQRMQSFGVPSGFTIRVTGPWPVTEFLELKQD